ncbi:MAG: GNAT family N-acetyltransferase [Chloroflexi bacterium]|nr:GNAT family N-acetyltransferase [Chloroflexota bacterium]
MELLPANLFTYEQLVEAYNETRIDYVVPMPMNIARMREYFRVYDIDLARSVVAMENNVIQGLGMLGIRENRSWITRLGVLPVGRRKGVGRAIMEELLRQACLLNLEISWLEVIKGNRPAHELFNSLSFRATRELIVARRPPNPQIELPKHIHYKSVTPLDHEDAIILLSHRQERPNWLNEIETFQHVKNLSALVVELENGGRGWVTYHAGLLQLTRVVVEVTAGDPIDVTAAILHMLHHRHKRQDTIAENLFDEVQYQGFRQVGYFEAFRRIEMKNILNTVDSEQ